MTFLVGAASASAIMGLVWATSVSGRGEEIHTPSLCVVNKTIDGELRMLGFEERVLWAEKDGTYRVLWVIPKDDAHGSQWVLVAGDPGGECTMRSGGVVTFVPSARK